MKNFLFLFILLLPIMSISEEMNGALGLDVAYKKYNIEEYQQIYGSNWTFNVGVDLLVRVMPHFYVKGNWNNSTDTGESSGSYSVTTKWKENVYLIGAGYGFDNGQYVTHVISGGYAHAGVDEDFGSYGSASLSGSGWFAEYRMVHVKGLLSYGLGARYSSISLSGGNGVAGSNPDVGGITIFGTLGMGW